MVQDEGWELKEYYQGEGIGENSNSLFPLKNFFGAFLFPFFQSFSESRAKKKLEMFLLTKMNFKP